MGSQNQLLIISPRNPIPLWVNRLSKQLSAKSIFTTPITHQEKTDTLILGFEDNKDLTEEFIFTDISLKAASIKVYRRNNGVNDLIDEVFFRTFKSEEEAYQHASYLLESHVKYFIKHKKFNHQQHPTEKAGHQKTSKIKRWFSRDNWIVATVDLPIESFLNAPTTIQHKPLFPENRGILRADPFGFLSKGKEWIFYEHQEPGKKGALHCATGDQDYELLKLSGHLSFPYVFEENGNIYCIPEKSYDGKCDLYEFLPQERKLNFIKSILHNIPASDAVIFKYEALYWIFCTDTSDQGANNRLLAFYSTSLNEEFQPHALNPLMVSLYGARNGGTPFEVDGKLYRPAQNNSKEYGGSILIFRTDELGPETFRQTLMTEIYPKQFGSQFYGIHTLSRLGDRTLIDLKTKIFTFSNLFNRMIKKRVST
jgi:hypothetical protein